MAARSFLEVLAVAHGAAVLPVAMFNQYIDRSAARLLGRADRRGSFQRGRSAHGFDGFEECPELSAEAFAEAREAFEMRLSVRYASMAPIIGRLAEALARDGRFAIADGIQDVANALERMYVLDEGKISRKLRNRAARYLGNDAESQEKIRAAVKEFYDTRSDIVHNRLDKVTSKRIRAAFGTGFEIARMSLFKLLREGPPEDWSALGGGGS